MKSTGVCWNHDTTRSFTSLILHGFTLTGTPQSKEAEDPIRLEARLFVGTLATIFQFISSKPGIWIQVTSMYLGFTPMDYLWLEPLEIFVQIT
jgi:hypothetical protein